MRCTVPTPHPTILAVRRMPVPLAIDGGERGLADAAQAVQRRDGDAALIAGERRLNCGERVVAAQEMDRDRDANLST
jgi:hypothetical protein